MVGGAVSKLDDYGLAGWLVLATASLAIAWPAGLAVVGFLIWSGRLKLDWRGAAPKRERFGANHQANAAFAEYRAGVLAELEAEDREFRDHLDRLRDARDREEFDRFMALRRRSSASP